MAQQALCCRETATSSVYRIHMPAVRAQPLPQIVVLKSQPLTRSKRFLWSLIGFLAHERNVQEQHHRWRNQRHLVGAKNTQGNHTLQNMTSGWCVVCFMSRMCQIIASNFMREIDLVLFEHGLSCYVRLMWPSVTIADFFVRTMPHKTIFVGANIHPAALLPPPMNIIFLVYCCITKKHK